MGNGDPFGRYNAGKIGSDDIAWSDFELLPVVF